PHATGGLWRKGPRTGSGKRVDRARRSKLMGRGTAVWACVLAAASSCNDPPAATVTPDPVSAPATPGQMAPSVESSDADANAAEGAELLAKAEHCYASASCSMADAEALYRQADDKGATGVSCYRLYYGFGVAKDLPRARACFERHVASSHGCDGSSP